MSFIKADKARIFYRWDGAEGLPPLVLSNSLGTTHAMWDSQIAALTEHQIAQVDLAFATGTLLGASRVQWTATPAPPR